MLDKTYIPAFLCLHSNHTIYLMKKLLLALSFLLSASLHAADEKKSVTYEGQITGVVCASCKAHVAGALTQKIPGIISVDVKAGDNADQQKLIIVAAGDAVTKESATEALGTYAKNYQIISLAKKQ
jgi:copper chaperone CopZ